MGLPWQPKDLISQHFLSWCWLHSMGWGYDRIEETLLIFNPDTDPQMWNSPEVDVLRVAFQILKEQRVSTVRESSKMSSKLQTGEFSMSSWLFQFLAEIWTAKGLLFLVSSMVTSKRGVTGPKFPIASILSARRRRWNINKLHDLDAMRKRTCSTRLHYTISSSHWWQESVRCRHLTGWSFISFLLFEADKGPLYPTRKEAFFRRHMTTLAHTLGATFQWKRRDGYTKLELEVLRRPATWNICRLADNH